MVNLVFWGVWVVLLLADSFFEGEILKRIHFHVPQKTARYKNFLADMLGRNCFGKN